MSLMRKFLGVRYQNCTIRASEFCAPMIESMGRAGLPEKENIIVSRQAIAQLDFGDKFAIYDFDEEQYFSWIRSLHAQVRGVRGQINDKEIKYLGDIKTPVEYELKRLNAGEDGNLEGCFLKGIMAGEEWVYKNPFAPARLSDDEIAVASCLDKMNNYVKGGPELYSLADASQDFYLAEMIKKAILTNKPVETQTQIWAR